MRILYRRFASSTEDAHFYSDKHAFLHQRIRLGHYISIVPVRNILQISFQHYQELSPVTSALQVLYQHCQEHSPGIQVLYQQCQEHSPDIISALSGIFSRYYTSIVRNIFLVLYQQCQEHFPDIISACQEHSPGIISALNVKHKLEAASVCRP